MSDIEKVFPQYDLICEAWLRSVYPPTSFPKGGGSTTPENNWYLAVRETEKCIIKAHREKGAVCHSSFNIMGAINLRVRVDEILKRARQMEKDGYPLYDTATLARMEDGVSRLYYRLLNLCDAELFSQIMTKIINAYNLNPGTPIVFAEIVGRMETLEAGYHKHPYLKKLAGDERWAAELLMALDVPMDAVYKYFPVDQK